MIILLMIGCTLMGFGLGLEVGGFLEWLRYDKEQEADNETD